MRRWSYLSCVFISGNLVNSLLEILHLHVVVVVIRLVVVMFPEDHVGGGPSPGTVSRQVVEIDLEA